MYCDLRDIDADLLTVSAHKIPPPILHLETNSYWVLPAERLMVLLDLTWSG